jgi:hypothetical protein
MQADTGVSSVDYGGIDTARKFAAIPGSSVTHLWHNKHELTWTLADRRAGENNSG